MCEKKKTKIVHTIELHWMIVSFPSPLQRRCLEVYWNDKCIRSANKLNLLLNWIKINMLHNNNDGLNSKKTSQHTYFALKNLDSGKPITWLIALENWYKLITLKLWSIRSALHRAWAYTMSLIYLIMYNAFLPSLCVCMHAIRYECERLACFTAWALIKFRIIFRWQ